ncbi:MAG: DUF3391 domain-containing protein [Burkholderiaceae bacterium]
MNKLTKLDVAGLRIGDHVRKIEGPWLQHGFWRRSFRIRDQQTLDELRASGVQYVWIDPERDADSQPADSDDRAQDVTLGDAAPTNPDVVPASGQPESMSAASDAEASAPAEAVDEAMVFEISKGPQPEPPCDAGAAPEPAAQPRIQAVNDSPATSEPLAEQPSARPPKPAPPGRMDPHALPSRQGQSRLHRKDRPSPPSERDWQRAQRICSMAKRVVTRIFDDACNGRQVDTESVMPVVDSVIESVADQPGTLTSLARLKQQDQYTFMHSVAVCGLMTTLGFELGLDDAAVREAATAGLVHDIGKMLVPMDILNKPGRLSAEEFASI